MKKIIFFFLSIALLFLAAGSCTKKIASPPAVDGEELTVVIGSVSKSGDTTVLLQTVVKPQ